MAVFVPSLKQRGYLDTLSFTIASVGSRKLGTDHDYGSLGWNLFAPNLTIYGFDADEQACTQANADIAARQVNWVEQHWPLALSDQVGRSTLYVTHHPMCSSLFPPNEPYLSRFAGLIELMGTSKTIEIETTTLDQFSQQQQIREIDFLQIDVQGADLNVLRGATQTLNQVLAVQIEVEFSSMYHNQPLFADVDGYLRSHGFTLFDLKTDYRARARSPLQSKLHPGQLLWADAFYFRDLIGMDAAMAMPRPEKLLKLACVADMLNFTDYALEVLEYLTVHYSNTSAYNMANAIMDSFQQFPELQEHLNQLPIINSIQRYVNGGSQP